MAILAQEQFQALSNLGLEGSVSFRTEHLQMPESELPYFLGISRHFITTSKGIYTGPRSVFEVIQANALVQGERSTSFPDYGILYFGDWRNNPDGTTQGKRRHPAVVIAQEDFYSAIRRESGVEEGLQTTLRFLKPLAKQTGVILGNACLSANREVISQGNTYEIINH